MTNHHWLVKSEPAKYAFSDLLRDGRTVWDGVRNNSAAQHLRAMKVGEQVFYYHSVEGLAVVGIAKVVRESFLDPSDPAGRFVAVELVPVRALARPVALAQMKANPALANMAMLRLFRLSVSPVTAEEWAEILAMAGEAEVGRPPGPGRSTCVTTPHGVTGRSLKVQESSNGLPGRRCGRHGQRGP